MSPSKPHPISTPWPPISSGFNHAAYWALALSALVFTYQYHVQAQARITALCGHSQLEKISIVFHSTTIATITTTGSSPSRHQPPLPLPHSPNDMRSLSLSLRSWRVATFLVFISQTLLALFAVRFTYSWIHKVYEWALREENGSRAVIMSVSPHLFLPIRFPPLPLSRVPLFHEWNQTIN